MKTKIANRAVTRRRARAGSVAVVMNTQIMDGGNTPSVSESTLAPVAPAVVTTPSTTSPATAVATTTANTVASTVAATPGTQATARHVADAHGLDQRARHGGGNRSPAMVERHSIG